MTVGAHFQINQAANPIPTGTVDVNRTDLRVGAVVHFVGDSVGNATPSWTITAWPAGSARGTPSSSTTFDASYTPDVPGSYRMQYLVNDGLATNARTFIFACTFDVNGLLYDDGIREPAFGETVGDDNTAGNDRSYAKPYEAGMAASIPVVPSVAALIARRANKHKAVALAVSATAVRIAVWDGTSVAAHDGLTVFQPGFGTTPLATGRWLAPNPPLIAGALTNGFIATIVAGVPTWVAPAVSALPQSSRQFFNVADVPALEALDTTGFVGFERAVVRELGEDYDYTTSIVLTVDHVQNEVLSATPSGRWLRRNS